MKESESIDIPGYSWFGHNRKEVHINAPTASGGVGILISDNIKNNYDISIIDKEYEGILALQITHKDTDFEILLISGYLPPENSPWGRNASGFFAHCLKLLYMYNNVDVVVLMGDLNSRIGNLFDYTPECDIISQRDVNIDPIVNNHGRDFIDFLCDSKMCVLNGRSPGPDNNNYTFSSTRGHSVVDYMISCHDSLHLFTDFKIEPCNDIVNKQNLQNMIGPNCRVPDHSMISVILHPNTYKQEFHSLQNDFHCSDREPETKRYQFKRIPPNFLNNYNVAQTLISIIDEIKCAGEAQEQLNAINNKVKNLIIGEMDKYLIQPVTRNSQKRYKCKKPYWNEELNNLWMDMHKSEVEARNFKGPRRYKKQLQDCFKHKMHLFDKNLKYYKRQYDRGFILRIEELNTSDPKAFWEQLNKLGPRRQKKIPMEYIDDNGNVITDVNAVLDSWRNEFQSIYNNDNDFYDDAHLRNCLVELQLKEQSISDPLYTTNNDLSVSVTVQEVQAIIHNLKNNKSPGLDKIPYEVWKNNNLLEVLVNLLQYCFDIGKIPTEWLSALIMPIPKPGKADYRTPLAYRGISLINCVYKIYTALINKRLQSFLESNNILKDQQNGFRSNRSCEDHIFVLDSLVNTKLQKGEQVVAGFIDFSKAFDLVDRDLLLLKLLRDNVDGKMYWALKSIYQDTRSCIRVNEHHTDWFNIHNGVRQGDPLSPTLFSVYINDLIAAIEESNIGVKFQNNLINILVFADDVVLIAENAADLQQLFAIVNDWTSKWRLTINNEKSAVLHFRNRNVAQTQFQFNLQGSPVHVQSNYKYLGVILNEHNDYRPSVKPLVISAGRALGGIINKFKGFRNVGYVTYKKLYNSCVVPIMEYGSAIWGNYGTFPEIDHVQNRALRYYLGVHRFTPLAAIRGDMAFESPEVGRNLVAARLWNKLLKLDDNRITKQVFLHDYVVNGVFCNSIKNICAKVDLQYCYNNKTVIDIKLLQEKLNANYVTAWKEQIELKPKLRLYKLIKSEYQVESYCKLYLSKFQRSLLAQLRAGVLPLHVETGRFSNTALELRTCHLCNSGDIETELHFLFDCYMYNNERQDLYSKITNTDITNLTNVEKLLYLFNHQLFIFASYVENIFVKRRTALYNQV